MYRGWAQFLSNFTPITGEVVLAQPLNHRKIRGRIEHRFWSYARDRSSALGITRNSGASAGSSSARHRRPSSTLTRTSYTPRPNRTRMATKNVARRGLIMLFYLSLIRVYPDGREKSQKILIQRDRRRRRRVLRWLGVASIGQRPVPAARYGNINRFINIHDPFTTVNSLWIFIKLPKICYELWIFIAPPTPPTICYDSAAATAAGTGDDHFSPLQEDRCRKIEEIPSGNWLVKNFGSAIFAVHLISWYRSNRNQISTLYGLCW